MLVQCFETKNGIMNLHHQTSYPVLQWMFHKKAVSHLGQKYKSLDELFSLSCLIRHPKSNQPIDCFLLISFESWLCKLCWKTCQEESLHFLFFLLCFFSERYWMVLGSSTCLLQRCLLHWKSSPSYYRGQQSKYYVGHWVVSVQPSNKADKCSQTSSCQPSWRRG